ncbi:MAG: C_GCAxxG_C_C family protein [Planctomycetes bacterium]|nr:C_GCAxxG_C_C family protein [Planctomycetota bacterium]
MRRRQFLETCAVSLAAVGSQGAAPALGEEDSAEEKPALADRMATSAREHFLAGKRSCCESILMAGCETLDIKSTLVPDIAMGLAGGVGLQGDTCGVLTGAAMVVSLAIAQKETEYAAKMKRTVQAAGRVHAEFKRQFGSTHCRTLCGLDLTTDEGRKTMAERVKAEKCAKFVEVGAKLLARELDAT